MTTTAQPLTNAQVALKNYYEAILALEKTHVISDHVGDALSSQMMQMCGDYEEYDGTTFNG